VQESERAELRAKLQAGRGELLASVEGLSDAEAAARRDGRWSAIGNIEHLTAVEANMLRGVQGAKKIEGEAKTGREARIFEQVRARSTKLQAPTPTHPKGECATLAEAIGKFDAVRDRTVAFLEACDQDLRLCTMTHPLLGEITGWECLHLVAAHPFRHAKQIREMRGMAR